jgi:nitrogen fixation NifU-like protein
MCGDYISIYFRFNDQERFEDVAFEGEGCAVLMASASMMTDLLKGKSKTETHEIVSELKKVLRQEVEHSPMIGELNVFSGLSQFQSRIKCALLAWDTLMKEIQ